MKVVILAGGMQSSISKEAEGIPKPMIDIGGKPLLWHIMKHFSQYGLTEFIVCGGYKVDTIKEYFMDFYIYESDITVDLQTNTVEIHKKKTEDWKVTVVDTGLFSTTGLRVSMIEKYVDGDFIVTYGDCLSDINALQMIKHHRREDKIATVAMVKPSGREELLPLDSDGKLRYGSPYHVENDNAWTNGDCFVFSPKVFSLLTGNYDLEKSLFIKLSERDQLATYKHTGYWLAVETKRDLTDAENLWNAGMAPWIESNP
ncbi:MAG: NTP transferase domain-containing protein [Lachnospiraceae bacterium]|nr:NTP transferase domain-containing protein [Lachnospiraceae bacterium]